jgi:hypothetical protein
MIQSSLTFRIEFGAAADGGNPEIDGSSGGDDEVDGNNVPNEFRRAAFTVGFDGLGPSSAPTPARLTSESGNADRAEANAVAFGTGSAEEEEGDIGWILSVLPLRVFSLGSVSDAVR